jgi:hypothetical protein
LNEVGLKQYDKCEIISSRVNGFTGDARANRSGLFHNDRADAIAGDKVQHSREAGTVSSGVSTAHRIVSLTRGPCFTARSNTARARPSLLPA